MLTLKEYADTLGLSYEAVRSSFKRHEGKELIEGIHFTREGRTTLLTESGISKMNEFRKQFRKQPVIVFPGDVAALEARIKDLQKQIEDLEQQKAALEAVNAELNLQITELTAKLNERNDALIDALFRLQTVQEKLLTTTAPPAPERKPGFFKRLFGQ